MNTADARKAIGLVLQGGGALGAFEWGVIECLVDNGIEPDVVSGVSIGAINAAVLCGARHSDVKVALRELWADLTTRSLPPPWDGLNQHLSLLGNPGVYRARTDLLGFARWTSYYDTSPLRRTLEKHVDLNKLRPENFDSSRRCQAPRLIVTATNVYTGKLAEFDSKVMPITFEHVIASASLPPGLPATPAPVPPSEGGGEQLYWDGALFDNTPLSKVIHALQDDPADDKTMYVVNLFPAQGQLPTNIPEVLTRMNSIAASSKTEVDLLRAQQTTDIIKFVDRLDELGILDASLTDHAGYKAVKRFKKKINIIDITNVDAAGIADFSAEGIKQRRLNGYAAAAEKVSISRQPGFTS